MFIQSVCASHPQQIVPMDCSKGLLVDISEVVCGDPNCAPIDTVVTLVWESGGKGMWGIPAELHQIGKEDYLEYFPVRRPVRCVMRKWRECWLRKSLHCHCHA